jgi:hypothetical protein
LFPKTFSVSHNLSLRSKKEKKHHKDKKSRHRRDKEVVVRVTDAPAGDVAHSALATKSSPAAPAHETDAFMPTKAAPAHAAADSDSDGGSEYGPSPLVAAVGDVG